MDEVTAAVIVLAILALVVVIGIGRAKGWFRGEVHGPGGSGASVEGGAPRRVKARKIRAGRDAAARGPSVDAREVDAGRDVTLDAGSADEGGHPKA